MHLSVSIKVRYDFLFHLFVSEQDFFLTSSTVILRSNYNIVSFSVNYFHILHKVYLVYPLIFGIVIKCVGKHACRSENKFTVHYSLESLSSALTSKSIFIVPLISAYFHSSGVTAFKKNTVALQDICLQS